MKIEHRKFNIGIWGLCSQKIIQPHIHELLYDVLDDPKNCYYREDLEG